MPDFSQLLRKPAGEAKRPPTLPAGDYAGIIKGQEVGDANQNHTPYARFAVGLVDWPSDCPNEWTQVDAQGQVYQVAKSDVDLSRRQMRRDFYLTDEALWRLDEFIRSCDVEPEGRSYEEILPELIGRQVVVQVEQYLNNRTNEIGNQIGRLIGAK